jgi:hypothetical protein
LQAGSDDAKGVRIKHIFRFDRYNVAAVRFIESGAQCQAIIRAVKNIEYTDTRVTTEFPEDSPDRGTRAVCGYQHPFEGAIVLG